MDGPIDTARERRRPVLIGLRILVYGWAALLVLQNFGILRACAAAVGDGLGSDPLSEELKVRAILAAAKLVLVGLGAVVHARLTNSATSVILAGAILYAYPFGRLVDPLVYGAAPASAMVLLSGYAVLSYATAAALACLWRATRES